MKSKLKYQKVSPKTLPFKTTHINSPHIDPEAEQQYHAEERAILKYWTTNKDLWVAQGRQTASEDFERGPSKKRKRESDTLESANVSNITTQNNNSDSHTLVPPPSKTHSWTKQTLSHTSSQLPETISQLPETISHTNSQLPEAILWKTQQRASHKGREIIEEKPITKSTEIVRSRSRRIPRHTKNSIRNRNKAIQISLLEMNEFQLMKENLARLGVARTNVHNLSKTTLSQQELDSLALGTKFIPTPKIDPDIIIEAQQNFTRTLRWRWIFDDSENEMPLYWIPSDKNPKSINNTSIEKAIAEIKSKITLQTKNTQYNMTQKQRQNLDKLLERNDIMVITADKNLGYTIVGIDWYKERCLEHLESKSYKELTQEFNRNDEGISKINEIYTTLTELINENKHLLEKEEIQWIKQTKPWKPMNFYILAKVHKSPIKGRPIVPSMTWITHNLSIWISDQLNPLLPQIEWILKDTNELLRTIHKINTSKKYINKLSTLELYSADVEALYPNIDTKLGLELMHNFLTEIEWETEPKINFLIQAMNFVLTQGFIHFQNRIFQQEDGAAMGSPMIPPYANIYMYMLERNTVIKYMKNDLIILYKRFIDDILIITRNTHSHLLPSFKNELNNTHSKIHLTWTEKNIKCNFLDITIEITDKNLIHTNVFQKPLNMYSYLPFHSYHTESHKKGFIKGEAIRYSRICSKKRDFDYIIKLFTIRLQRRGYPLHFINDAMGEVKWNNRIQHLFKQPPSKKRIPLLYKIRYSPIFKHRQLRKTLNEFTSIMKNTPDTPLSLKEKITICYQLPPKLHKHILKARKQKGF